MVGVGVGACLVACSPRSCFSRRSTSSATMPAVVRSSSWLGPGLWLGLGLGLGIGLGFGLGFGLGLGLGSRGEVELLQAVPLLAHEVEEVFVGMVFLIDPSSGC